MYFKDRCEAGYQLGLQLLPYRYENSIVVALSDGGVLVGEQIAAQLHCLLTMLLTKEINLPGEKDPIGALDQAGGFVYNDMFSMGQIEEYNQEFYNTIEASKLEGVHDMHRIFGGGGLLNNKMLKDRVVILVSDGLISGMSLVVAVNYLKTAKTKKLIIATPLASVSAVDKMHLLADKIVCLSTVEGTFDVSHYYDQNPELDHQSIIDKLNEIILQWQ